MSEDQITVPDEEAAVSVDQPLPDEVTPTPPDNEAATTTPPEGSDADSGNREPEKPDEGTTPEPERAKNSAEERISQLVQQRNEAEARAALAEQELQRLQGGTQRPEDYEDLEYEEQQAVDVKAAVRETFAEEKQAEAQNAADEAAKLRQQVFNEKVNAARERMPDFDQVFYNNAALQITDSMADLITDSDYAADVAHYLGQNPAVSHQIASLPAHRQGAEIARIEARVGGAINARKTTEAPDPPPTVGAHTAPDQKSPADMSQKEYEAWRAGSA